MNNNNAASPIFTPDGKEIIYKLYGKGKHRSIMAVSIEGGEPREIWAKDQGFSNKAASWLPDGRYVFDMKRGGPSNMASVSRTDCDSISQDI